MFIYNQSNIGYRHINENKVLQDYSASYSDNERSIITCCDGHGGELYVRSHLGSKFASDAVMKIFKDLTAKDIRRISKDKAATSIRLSILCEWNRLVKENLAHNRLKKAELANLSNSHALELIKNPRKAFGTTLTGTMLYGGYIVLVAIGDSEVIGVKKGNMIPIFDDENDPAANFTYSMCQDDAFDYIKVKILKRNDLDGIILCTDGLSSPYQSYENFRKSFIYPVVYRTLTTGSYSYVRGQVNAISNKLGTGDDVSISFMLFNNAKSRYYRQR